MTVTCTSAWTMMVQTWLVSVIARNVIESLAWSRLWRVNRAWHSCRMCVILAGSLTLPGANVSWIGSLATCCCISARCSCVWVSKAVLLLSMGDRIGMLMLDGAVVTLPRVNAMIECLLLLILILWVSLAWATILVKRFLLMVFGWTTIAHSDRSS